MFNFYNTINTRGMVGNLKEFAENKIESSTKFGKLSEVKSKALYKCNFQIDEKYFTYESKAPSNISNGDEVYIYAIKQSDGSHNTIIYKNFTNNTNNYNEAIGDSIMGIFGSIFILFAGGVLGVLSSFKGFVAYFGYFMIAIGILLLAFSIFSLLDNIKATKRIKQIT